MLYEKGEIYPLAKDEAIQSLSVKRPPGAKDEVAPISGLIADKSESEQNHGFRKLAYREELLAEFSSLRPTAEIEKVIERIRIRRGDAKAPSAWTIYRCDLAIQEAGGNVAAAFPNYSKRGGPGKRRMDAITWDALKESLQAVCSSNGRILYSDIYEDVEHKLISRFDNDAPLFQPSYSTVVRHTKSVVNELEMAKRNRGRKQAAREFDEWTPRMRAIAPLQRYECDDKNTGVFGVCSRTLLPLGKIWLTVVLDQYSRMPVGHVVAGRAPNQWTALNSLINAIMPKDPESRSLRRVKSDAPYCGLPSRIIFDNALQNHAMSIDAAIVEFCGIGISYAKPYCPHHKANIENYNGRMVKEFLADLPGFIGPKLSRDFLTEAKAKATATLEEFEELYLAWVYDVYANKPGVDGRTPLQLWSEGMIDRKPRFPGDVFRMRLAAMPIETRKLRPEQINFHGLIYQHGRLQEMIKRGGLGKDVVFKYDPTNLGCVWFKDPFDGQWYMANSTHPEYTRGLTMYQHRSVKRLAFSDRIRNPSRKQYLEFKMALKEWVRELSGSKKMVERAEAQLLTLDETSHPVLISNTVQMGELEARLHDIKMEVEEEMSKFEVEMTQDLGEHMWSLDANVQYD
jgi:putative transposase